jgi:hypothetical protein
MEDVELKPEVCDYCGFPALEWPEETDPEREGVNFIDERGGVGFAHRDCRAARLAESG